MPITYEELERLSYMSGDTKTADLCTRIIDGDLDEAARTQHFEEESRSYQNLADSYAEDLKKSESEREYLQEQISAVKTEIMLALSKI